MDDVISIPNIGIQKVGVNEIAIPNVTSTVPVYQPPPVVVNIGAVSYTHLTLPTIYSV